MGQQPQPAQGAIPPGRPGVQSGSGASTPTPPTAGAFIDRLWKLPDRRTVMLISLGSAAVFVLLLTIIFPKDSHGAEILTDRSRFSHFPYPFTIQNLEHFLFFIGLGELFVRWRVAKREHEYLEMHLLPEDQETVLQPADLGSIR